MKHETVYIPGIDVVCSGLPPRPWECPVCKATQEIPELEEALDKMESRAVTAEDNLAERTNA